MKNPKDIHSLFASWGAGERQLPGRNEELKKAVLAQMPSEPRVVSMPVYRLPWLSYAFGVLAVITFLVGGAGGTLSTPTVSTMPADMADSDGSVTLAVAPQLPMMARDAAMEVEADMLVSNQAQTSMAPSYAAKGGGAVMPEYYPRPYPYQDPSVPITDTREFLRTDYNVSIRTREVQELTRRAETTVRGFGGRVDGSSSAEKWGSVSFAVPASKFDAFRDEIESFVGKRFITVETRTENMLPQKQSIEEQRKQIEKNAAELRTQRKNLIASHNSKVSSLQTQINNVSYELTALRSELTADPARRAYIDARIKELVTEQATLQTRLNNENSSYGRQLNEFDARIKDTESGLDWVATQDKNLIDTVATIRGTISFGWISIGDIIQLYISPSWIALLLVAAAIGAALWSRRRSRMELL
jgi:flagellar capping protein FliD